MNPEWTVTLGENHPSLAGHFPGHPVIPGVLMLGEVMNVIRRAATENIEFVAMPSAKFLAPLHPGESLTIRLDQQSGCTTEFICTAGSRVIATGCVQYRMTSKKDTSAS